LAYKCEATKVKETKNYQVFQFEVDENIMPLKFYVHKDLFKDELKEDKQIVIQLKEE